MSYPLSLDIISYKSHNCDKLISLVFTVSCGRVTGGYTTERGPDRLSAFRKG